MTDPDLCWKRTVKKILQSTLMMVNVILLRCKGHTIEGATKLMYRVNATNEVFSTL